MYVTPISPLVQPQVQKMAERIPLTSSQHQFGQVEYLLQLALHATTARVVGATAISNPHLTVNFERKCKDILTLDAWIDPSQLMGLNSEEQIAIRGFQLENQGIFCTVGEIKSMLNPGQKVHKLLLCKVGVGRSYVSDDQKVLEEPIPEGYDSFYLINRAPADNVYSHQYYIKNSAAVLPLYMVQFEYDEDKERRSRDRPICEACEKAPATVWCTADNASLCNHCDSLMHNNKLTARHNRTPIGTGQDVFGACRFHSEKNVEFFCSQCHVPVCVHCKMVGHHSSGEASRHKLISVAEAYTSVLEEAGQPDRVFEQRQQIIKNQLSAISQRHKSVVKMAEHLTQQIQAMATKAIAELEMIKAKKTEVLLGDEVELRRQLGEMQMLDEFLTYQQTGDAATFLHNFARHQGIRDALHQARMIREEIDVQLDMKVNGSITVTADGSAMSPQRKGLNRPASSFGVQPIAPAVPQKSPTRLGVKGADLFAEVMGQPNIAPNRAYTSSPIRGGQASPTRVPSPTRMSPTRGFASSPVNRRMVIEDYGEDY